MLKLKCFEPNVCVGLKKNILHIFITTLYRSSSILNTSIIHLMVYLFTLGGSGGINVLWTHSAWFCSIVWIGNPTWHTSPDIVWILEKWMKSLFLLTTIFLESKQCMNNEVSDPGSGMFTYVFGCKCIVNMIFVLFFRPWRKHLINGDYQRQWYMANIIALR